jgi:hypothetical protein
LERPVYWQDVKDELFTEDVAHIKQTWIPIS